jgi:serine/threonine protein kinase
MAEAYLAHQDGMAGFKKQIVIKVLHAHHAHEPATVELFLREARVGGRLNHANIIQIFDLGEDKGQPFIAMEFVEGLSLLQATKRCWAMGGGIPIDAAVRIVAAAADGLHHAHTLKNSDGSEGGIIHRDVSPDNIMIARDGNVKVLDFGVARIGGAEATRSGDIKGKIPFMPPEQVQGNIDVDARADLYALGVCLYWCLTARRPFAGGNDAGTMKAILEETPAPVRRFNPNVTPELEAVVMNLLEKDREKRPPSAAKLASRLKKVLPPTQENPVAKFIERLRMFDDDPPEKRPEARATGGWPAVVLPAETTDASQVMPLVGTSSPSGSDTPPEPDTRERGTDTLIEQSSSAFELVPQLASHKGAPRGISGLFGADQLPPNAKGATARGIADIPEVEDHESEGMRSTTVQSDAPPYAEPNDEATARNDVTLDENAKLPSLDDLSAASTVVLPGEAARVQRQRTMIFVGAAGAGLLLALILAIAYASRDIAPPPNPPAPQPAPVVVQSTPPTPVDEVRDLDEIEALFESSGPAARPAPKTPEATREVFVVAPQSIRWLTVSGRVLGEGSRALQVPESDKVIVAHDRKRDGRTSVPVAKHIDYGALPRGTLRISVKPTATNVKLGTEPFGPTPIGPIDVVAGTYKVTVENKGTVVVRQVKVRAGTETPLSVDVPAAK